MSGMRGAGWLVVILWMMAGTLWAQSEDLSCVWPAKWIVTPDAPLKEFGVHHFRRTFSLDSLPDSLIVHSSGDNRYQLFVNGSRVTWGPQRGDLRHWYYESTDLVPYLRRGRNVIAAVVLNYGARPPDAQLSVQTAFLLTADRREYRYLNTGSGKWRAYHDPAYRANPVTPKQVAGYYGAGSKERVDGRRYPWGWEAVDYDAGHWPVARVVESAFARGCRWASRWKLTPRSLPLEHLQASPFAAVRRGRMDRIPADTTVSFVLDFGDYFTGYPDWTLSGGRGAELTFTYVEAPHYGELRDRNKGHRGEIAGKTFTGVQDVYVADGGRGRTYRPLYWRAGRYVEVEVRTAGEALTIDSVRMVETNYPFPSAARWWAVADTATVDTSLLRRILTIGDRTLRANAHEHYMDCPYYEESQFEGDTRIQALAGYYSYGDPRLARQAIEQFSWSLNEEGFVSARYPTNSLYYIPNYSLYWIGMLRDYAWLVDDPDFVREKLPVARAILDYFYRHQRPDGRLLPLDYHEFIDWAFKAGEAPRDSDGYGAIPDLSFLQALQWAADLEEHFGDSLRQARHLRAAAQLRTTIRQTYRDPATGLITDVPGDTGLISEHANSLAILTGVVTGREAGRLFDTLQTIGDRTRATLYWRFYLNEAMSRAGRGDHYLHSLQPWETMVELGASTWPETGPHSRSECHGWGASPNYHFYSIVAGITSTTPGWRQVRIAPELGPLKELEVHTPHPAGFVELQLKRTSDGLSATVTLPPGTTGTFHWQGQERKLRAGTQVLRIPEIFNGKRPE